MCNHFLFQKCTNSKIALNICNGVDTSVNSMKPFNCSLINMLMSHLEFTDLDPLIFSNIKIPLFENTSSLYIFTFNCEKSHPHYMLRMYSINWMPPFITQQIHIFIIWLSSPIRLSGSVPDILAPAYPWPCPLKATNHSPLLPVS